MPCPPPPSWTPARGQAGEREGDACWLGRRGASGARAMAAWCSARPAPGTPAQRTTRAILAAATASDPARLDDRRWRPGGPWTLRRPTSTCSGLMSAAVRPWSCRCVPGPGGATPRCPDRAGSGGEGGPSGTRQSPGRSPATPPRAGWLPRRVQQGGGGAHRAGLHVHRRRPAGARRCRSRRRAGGRSRE